MVTAEYYEKVRDSFSWQCNSRQSVLVDQGLVPRQVGACAPIPDLKQTNSPSYYCLQTMKDCLCERRNGSCVSSSTPSWPDGGVGDDNDG